MEHVRRAFAAEVARPENDIDLGRAALLISAEAYSTLEVDDYRRRLDDLAAGVRLSGDEGPAGVIAAINAHLYGRLGFRGNREAYYDPRNSYLNDVIDRRLGIPITLAVVYLEVARRLGHPMTGVNLPAHFMLAYRGILIDAFDGGTIVSAADCAARLEAIYGMPVQVGPEHLEPVGSRGILRRMLNNLRVIFTQREEYGPALAALERMEICQPTLEGARDRGLLLFRLGRHREAETELARYLAIAPDAPDRVGVEGHLEWVRRLLASAN